MAASRRTFATAAVFTAVIALSAAAFGVAPPADNPAEGECPASWPQQGRQFRQAEQYLRVSETGSYPVFTMDDAAARAAGVSESAIILMTEIAAFQTAWAQSAANPEADGLPEFQFTDFTAYPAMTAHRETAAGCRPGRDASRAE